jgi:hypothetical protein
MREEADKAQKEGRAKPVIQVPVPSGYSNMTPPGIRIPVPSDYRSSVEQKIGDGLAMFGITPEDTLAAVAPKTETVTVTAPAPAKKQQAADPSGITPQALPKLQAGILRMAGAGVGRTVTIGGDPAVPAAGSGTGKERGTMEGLLLHGDPANLALAGQYHTGKAKITAESPPLPQAAAELEAVVISPNARSKDNPWVYAVLAVDYKASARNNGATGLLPSWTYPGRLGAPPEGLSEPGAYTPNTEGWFIATTSKGGLRGMSADGTTQTLHGIRGREGWDAQHEAAPHVHHQGPDAAMTLEAAKYLKSKGWPITEFKGMKQAVGGHSETGGHYDSTAFDVPVPISQQAAVLKDLNDFYVSRGRGGQGIRRAGGALNENHPYVQAIGYAEGNLDRNGRPTGSYAGHTDPGNGARNVGIFSAQNSGSTPEAANRAWLGKLNKVMPVFDNALRKRGVNPGSKVYDNIMANLLDLYVQAPAAVQGEGGLLSRVNDMIRFKGDPTYIAQVRAESFRKPSGGLDAPGFGNNWNRLLQDQRRRAKALRERLS